jgi:Holliday junction resolvasome RuvABC endonuclease subunit
VTTAGIAITATGSAVATLAESPTITTFPTSPVTGSLINLVRAHVKLADEIADSVGRAELAAVSTCPTYPLSGMWWMTVTALTAAGIPVAIVSPAVLTKFVTGNGKASRLETATAIQRNWPDVNLPDEPSATALGLAMMAAAHLGLESGFRLTKARRTALVKVGWSVSRIRNIA